MHDLDSIDKKIIGILQEELPMVAEPYQAVAEAVGINEEELLERIGRLKSAGKLRRIGAILHHRKSGFDANALVVWQVPTDQLDSTGQKMAQFSQVTHCYYRPSPSANWPYNLYTMVHSSDHDACFEIIREIASAVGIQAYDVLFSTRELKKSSVRYT